MSRRAAVAAFTAKLAARQHVEGSPVLAAHDELHYAGGVRKPGHAGVTEDEVARRNVYG